MMPHYIGPMLLSKLCTYRSF